MERNITEKLEILIGIRRVNKNTFDRERLIKNLESEFGGQTSNINIGKDTVSFNWSGINREQFLQAAKTGTLDKIVAAAGGDLLLEATNANECLYQFIPEIKFKEPKIENIPATSVNAIKEQVQILIITVNDRESGAVLHTMKPWPGEQKILQGAISTLTYRFGRFGNYFAVHAGAQLGTNETFGINNVIRTAIGELSPKAILLLGLAFGFDNKRYRFGDILVAQTIMPYEYGKAEASGEVSMRGIAKECNITLADRLNHHSKNWHHYWLKGVKAKEVQKLQGTVLSGEKVVNNKAFRDRIYEKFKDYAPIGGEMEGGAAYNAVRYINEFEKKDIAIILIKGICDWADGHKDDRAQPFAAFTATSLAEYVLKQPDVLHSLGIAGIDSNPH